MNSRFFNIAGVLVLALAILSMVAVNVYGALVVSPTNQKLLVYTYRPFTFEYNVSNTGNDTIYFLNFSVLKDFQFATLTNLSANQTATLRSNITTDTAYQTTLSGLLYYYVKSGVPVETGVYNVSITSNQFLPNDITIFAGSTVQWYNNDTLTQTVSGSFANANLSPNASFSFTFNAEGNFSYFSSTTNIQGVIRVLNPAPFEFVHNPTLDVPMSYQVDSVLVETELSMDIIITNLTIPYDKSRGGVLHVKNDFNQTAKRVRPGANQWITYSIADPLGVFDLAPGEEQFVVFTLQPLVNNVNETGQNYTITLFVSANNTLEISKNISIEVPKVLEITNVTSLCDFFREKKTFCDAYPSSAYCVTEPLVRTVDRIVYQSPPLSVNYSSEQVVEMGRAIIIMKDEMQRINNFVKEQNAIIHNDTRDALAGVSRTESAVNVLVETGKNNESALRNISIAAFAILFLVVLFGVGGYFGRKWYIAYRLGKATQT